HPPTTYIYTIYPTLFPTTTLSPSPGPPRGAVGARPAAPEGYRVVTEEQFRTYRETGEVPAEEPAPTDEADRDATDETGGTATDEVDQDPTDRTDLAATGEAERAATDAGREVPADEDRAGAGGARPADRDS
ncbi:hypothetical protein ACWEH1_21515, partial [Micromonospora chersina]